MLFILVWSASRRTFVWSSNYLAVIVTLSSLELIMIAVRSTCSGPLSDGPLLPYLTLHASQLLCSSILKSFVTIIVLKNLLFRCNALCTYSLLIPPFLTNMFNVHLSDVWGRAWGRTRLRCTEAAETPRPPSAAREPSDPEAACWCRELCPPAQIRHWSWKQIN